MEQTVGVGARGISCQMCNKIKSSWWPDTSIKECLKGYQKGFYGKFACARMENTCRPTTQSLAKMLSNITQRLTFNRSTFWLQLVVETHDENKMRLVRQD